MINSQRYKGEKLFMRNCYIILGKSYIIHTLKVYLFFQDTVAILSFKKMFFALSPGFCPCISKSSFTCGPNIRQCVEPPKWNIPSWSPFLTRCPSMTVIWQDEISVIPTGITHISPIAGLSASININALVASSVINPCDSFYR